MINILCRRVLRLATVVLFVQAVVSLTIFVYLVFMSRTSTHIVTEILDVTLTIAVNVLVMRAGVFAVESRNAVCCCGWRSMQIFYTWYVVICIFHAVWIVMVFVFLALWYTPDNDPEWTELVVEGLFLNVLTLILNASIADYTRRLLLILPKDDEELVQASRVPSFNHGATTVVESEM